MNLEREIKINKILLILLITLSIGTIALRTSHAMFSKKETFNNVLRIITGNELPRKGVNDLIEKAGTSTEEIQGIDPATGTLCSSDCKEYRYTGASVKNYVKLTNLNPNDVTKTQEELWRIIGIFTDEDSGEKYMRLVRDEVLSESYLPKTYYVINGKNYWIKASGASATGITAYWNYLTGTGSDNNNWPTAGLQYYLNREKDDGSNKGYMSYLSDETKSMLRETKHYLGTYIHGEDTVITSYQHERDVKSCVNNKGAVSSSSNFPKSGCNVWNGNDATWSGKISLMYPSDVGFAASSEYWGYKKMSLYSQTAVRQTSWMYKTMVDSPNYYSWLLSTSSKYSYYVAIFSLEGSVSDHYVYYHIMGVRPVLNIKSNVKIKDGTVGSRINPYIFEI